MTTIRIVLALPLHLFVRQAITEKVAAIGAYADPKSDP